MLGVVQKTPVELLSFLEGVVGTECLRREVERELASTLQLQQALAEANTKLASERLLASRHQSSFAAWLALEECRRALDDLAVSHLQKEACFHAAALRNSAATHSSQQQLIESARQESAAKLLAFDAVQESVKSNESARARARSALALAQRKASRMKEESSRLHLTRKQHETAAARAKRASEGVRLQVTRAHDQERQLQLDTAAAISGARTLQQRSQDAASALEERESAMDAVEEEAHHPGQQPADADARMLMRDIEQRLAMRPSARCRSDSTQQRVAQRRRAEAEHQRLLKQRPALAVAVASAGEEVEAERRTSDGAARVADENAQREAMLKDSLIAQRTAIDDLLARITPLEARLEALTASASTDKRVRAIAQLRQPHVAFARSIQGAGGPHSNLPSKPTHHAPLRAGAEMRRDRLLVRAPHGEPRESTRSQCRLRIAALIQRRRGRPFDCIEGRPPLFASARWPRHLRHSRRAHPKRAGGDQSRLPNESTRGLHRSSQSPIASTGHAPRSRLAACARQFECYPGRAFEAWERRHRARGGVPSFGRDPASSATSSSVCDRIQHSRAHPPNA